MGVIIAVEPYNIKRKAQSIAESDCGFISKTDNRL